MNRQQFEALRDMQIKFKELYDAPIGLLGIQPDHIQVSEQAFSDLVDDFDAWQDVRVTDRGEFEKYRYEATVVLEGVEWLTIGSAEEFDAVNIPVGNAVVEEAEDE